MDETWFVPMDDKHLAQFGENTARSMRPMGLERGRGVRRAALADLREIERVRSRVSEDRSAAAEWLLDNWYLAQREGQSGAAAFRRVRGLRYVLREGRRVLVAELARAFVRAAGADAGPERLGIFLNAAQSALPLTETELSLLIPALQCALVERLAVLCRELEHTGDADPDRLSAGMESVFTALRTLSGADLTALLEASSKVECLLRRDPAGVYPKMDDDTRARYRAQVCRLARKSGLSELDTAQKVLDAATQSRGEARHVGSHLFPRKPDPWAGGLYLGAVVVGTLFLTLLVGLQLDSLPAALLLLLPISDVVKNCADFLAVRLVRPRPVFRMALKEGIPAEGRTLCVIASLLTGGKSGDALAGLLEEYRLANRDAGPELLFGLLADLPDRDRPMGVEERVWVEQARSAIERLNKKYGGGFYLFFRDPVFHAPDERYMGWERKRGALVELVRLLKGRRSGLRAEAGDGAPLKGVKYVITLDSDTALSVGTAAELTGAMLHPLNRPKVDRRRKVVTEGYGLLQPRVSVDLESANRSQFSRIFAGQGGVDPYGSAASDVYHDLFDQGTYTGKGIFDVDVFYTCLDRRLPGNAVLSHDLLEGSYLRAGLIGDVELTDGYPYKVTSYFSRMHRWVRGDWQLLPWLLGRTTGEDGRREANPLSPIARWKMLDNLRRSLSPVFTLLALLLGMCRPGPVFAFAAGAAVLSAASHLLLSGADLVFRRGRGLTERYHSTIIAGFGGVILQTLVQLLFLPYHAWVCLTAALTALWRMGVSRRGLLAWTTAAEAERRAEDGVWAYYRKMWPSVLTGLFCILCSGYPLGGAAGLVWLAAPGFAWCMSRPIKQTRAVPREDRPFLLHQAALIWGYFADFLRPQDHYLPPDNYQEQPAVGLARRTSPTNIGMALLCCAAAHDLDLIPRGRALSLLGHMLDTLEQLPKWNGHLYNWYDTASAAPMEPRYVSTVDSGNLCGCLIALREILLEWGEQGLAARADALGAAMDFALLYDESRKLFTIGYDCSKEAYSQGWYDLMASEARQTSYLAVARGEVPPRHWRRLSRALVGQDHYRGMASWTGTMFEYFMPHLLLPAYQNSLLYESLSFCVYAQKRRCAGTDAPWGISESCFYTFDGAMNYQYKAHGVQRLGLRRGLDRELVISPYSTFLALLTAPRSALRNLRRLRGLGLEGPYGLYEAADFTPGRRSAGEKFAPVRSYMAHHLGMSLLAIDNALNDGVMQKRFLRDRSMAAYRELLQEKVPVGAQVMRACQREVPEKPGRGQRGALVREGSGFDPVRPECHLVFGGAWRVLCTDAGAARSRMGKTDLTRCIWDRQFAPCGVSFFLKTGEGLLPLTPAPLYQEGPAYGWRFTGAGASWTARWAGYETESRLTVPDRENGELREVRVLWTGAGEREAELICYLEPVVARLEDFEAHPAFSKLSLESAFVGDGVVFTRRARRSGENRPALAVLWDAAEAGFDTAREAALGRGGLKALPAALERPAAGTAGAVLDPCLLARFPLTLRAGETVSVRLALSAADDARHAADGALDLLRISMKRGGGGMDRVLEQIGAPGMRAIPAFDLLRRLQFPGKPWVKRGSAQQRALWPYGISGDLPILAMELREESELARAEGLIWDHQFLSRCGFAFDLVFLLSEGGDYRHPLRDSLEEALRAGDWGHRLGVSGGVFLVENAPVQVFAQAALMEGAAPAQDRLPIVVTQNHFTVDDAIPPWRMTEEGAFQFSCGPSLPPLGWSIMLSNPRFGWMTDETGGGHLWHLNAKENPLTAWNNDPLAVGGPERLALRVRGGEVSWFAEGDGNPCTVTYRTGAATWEKEWQGVTLRCTAFVPPEEDARYLLLEAKGVEGEVVYRREGMPPDRFPFQGALCLRTAPDSAAAPCERKRAEALLAQTLNWWKERVSALRVHTPDQALDDYLNGWALYQVTACRLFGRTSLYQNGGAFGFRDQLQDVCALLNTAPELVKDQILRACAHQYREGDVMHWWHPASGEGEAEKGVRTRISDDLLWLPYVLCAYVEGTGDRDILKERAAFLTSPPLASEERERFEEAVPAEETASVLEHAARAIRMVQDRGFGPHGLVKMGTGDWNDGMDLVGAGGTGESVWLTWFLALVCRRFAALTGEESYRALAEDCIRAANAAWDGDWFLRGWYDDGRTLGSHADEACQIDSIPQSFAAFCPGADKEKALRGIRSALDRLFDRDRGIVKLFTPPFDAGDRDPGYIRGYLPGVRENGGQYTHAAVWLALGCFRMGLPDEGAALLHALLPATHDPEVYRAEPFVLAADVYANPQHPGRGGWSWYTGAAGWYYRVAVEELLGLQVRDGALFLSPSLPAGWSGYTAEWNGLAIQVERGGTPGLTVDGRPHEGGIPLTGSHKVRLCL